jgi:two-component system chemotaxis response regulator CheB
MEKIKVLIVDDSSIMRKLISKIVSTDSDLEVVDTAMNGLFALKKIKKYAPDVVLLDLEMPGMNGVDFLKMRNELGINTPVIVISSLGKSHPEVIFKTIELGASDFIIKPSGPISMDIESLSEEIVKKVHYYHKKSIIKPQKTFELDREIALRASKRLLDEADKNIIQKPGTTAAKYNLNDKIKRIKRVRVLVIGISTGGPNALRTILPRFGKNFPLPILIVQHMPPGFTYEFAKGLNEICPLNVCEATDGEEVKSGNVYIAPGNRHLEVLYHGLSPKVYLDDDEPCNGHKPSAGKLYNSVKQAYGNEVIAVIMTGMGKDGAAAINDLSSIGALTIAQSEETCVVYGMPKVAVEIGGIDKIVDLERIPDVIFELLSLVDS